jgi:hypothetical protein
VWLLVAITMLTFFDPPTPPPASPALAQGASAGGEPVELAAPLTYAERFSPEAIGPERGCPAGCQCMDCFPYVPAIASDWAWAEAATNGCPIAVSAVAEQEPGE